MSLADLFAPLNSCCTSLPSLLRRRNSQRGDYAPLSSTTTASNLPEKSYLVDRHSVTLVVASSDFPGTSFLPPPSLPASTRLLDFHEGDRIHVVDRLANSEYFAGYRDDDVDKVVGVFPMNVVRVDRGWLISQWSGAIVGGEEVVKGYGGAEVMMLPATGVAVVIEA